MTGGSIGACWVGEREELRIRRVGSSGQPWAAGVIARRRSSPAATISREALCRGRCGIGSAGSCAWGLPRGEVAEGVAHVHRLSAIYTGALEVVGVSAHPPAPAPLPAGAKSPVAVEHRRASRRRRARGGGPLGGRDHRRPQPVLDDLVDRAQSRYDPDHHRRSGLRRVEGLDAIPAHLRRSLTFDCGPKNWRRLAGHRPAGLVLRPALAVATRPDREPEPQFAGGSPAASPPPKQHGKPQRRRASTTAQQNASPHRAVTTGTGRARCHLQIGVHVPRALWTKCPSLRRSARPTAPMHPRPPYSRDLVRLREWLELRTGGYSTGLCWVVGWGPGEHVADRRSARASREVVVGW